MMTKDGCGGDLNTKRNIIHIIGCPVKGINGMLFEPSYPF